MPLQYISDNTGKRTAIVMPINEWAEIVRKHADLKNLAPAIDSVDEIPLMKEFKGLLTKEQGEQLLQHVEQSRNEWEHRI